jgi:hypothetical protein
LITNPEELNAEAHGVIVGCALKDRDPAITTAAIIMAGFKLDLVLGMSSTP